MLIEKNVPLRAYNTFGINARAHTLVRVTSEADVLALKDAAQHKLRFGG